MSKFKFLTDSNFHSVVDSQETVLVKFGAEWCSPCKALSPIIEQIADETCHPVYEMDVDDETDIAAEFKVKSLPTVIIFKNGQVHNRIIGLTSKENILKLFQ